MGFKSVEGMLAEIHQSFKEIFIDICIWVKPGINQTLMSSQMDSGKCSEEPLNLDNLGFYSSQTLTWSWPEGMAISAA